MKYYYTDPMAAAWMAKHFGMKFTSSFELCDEYSHQNHCYYQAQGVADDKLFIHPNSLHLLEPQVGDLCIRYPDKRGHCNYCGMDWLLQIESKEDLQLWNGDIHKIIQRNGIAFMMPKCN